LENGFRANRNSHVERVANFQAVEARRRYPNDFDGLRVQGQLLADNCGIAAELPLPQAMADHCALQTSARTIVLRAEYPAQQGLDTKDSKEISADPQTTHGAGLTPGARIEPGIAPGEYSREPLLMIPDVFPYWIS